MIIKVTFWFIKIHFNVQNDNIAWDVASLLNIFLTLFCKDFDDGMLIDRKFYTRILCIAVLHLKISND